MKSDLRPFLNRGALLYENEAEKVLFFLELSTPHKWLILSDLEFAVLAECDGNFTLEELAARQAITIDKLKQILDRLSFEASSLIAWAPSVSAMRQQERLYRAAYDLRARHEAVALTQSSHQLATYHETEIEDAFQQFDEVESTVSHLFREPHVALANRSFGASFCDKVIEPKPLNRLRILEIGGGTGAFARCFLDRLKQNFQEVYDVANYTILDLSPALQSSQRAQCARHVDMMEFIQGNIENWQSDDLAFDLIIANEVIADLPVGVVDPDCPDRHNEAEQLVKQYSLAPIDARHPYAVNVGAIRLIERLAEELLAPGGRAFLTEYGGLEEAPRSVLLGTHREHSIQFGHLIKVAENRSLGAKIENMGDFMGFDKTTEVLKMEHLKLLTQVLPGYLGSERKSLLSLDRDRVRELFGPLLCCFRGLEFQPLERSRLSPFNFQALQLSVSIEVDAPTTIRSRNSDT